MYSARKYGDTCPYCNTEIERVNLYSNTGRRTMIDDPDKTMPIMGTEENADPVTGWLVCIEGTQYGKDYKIHSGKNFIGRADNMHIQILGDNAISRVNHAAIIYDAKNRSTYLLPGDSSGLAYHNGEAVNLFLFHYVENILSGMMEVVRQEKRMNKILRMIKEIKSFAIGNNLYADIGNAQTIGTREKQDDSFGTCIKPYGVQAIVADGIGGYVNGKLASQITVETFLDEFDKRDVTDNLSYFFQKTAILSNERIRDEFGETKGGTTVVSVVLKDDKMFWTSVGDSNIAVFRKDRLIMVNRKENVKNWLENQYYAGYARREEVLDGKSDKRLVNYLGYDGFRKADEGDRPILLKKKDRVLLYSDGVEILGQIGLENILKKRMSAQKMADAIIQSVVTSKKIKKDNATIVVLKIK